MAPQGVGQPLIWINGNLVRREHTMKGRRYKGARVGLLFSRKLYRPSTGGAILFHKSTPAEAAMLAEKFFLVLETLRSHASDGSVKVISTAPHVPANVLPSQK
jgi:hypothetical protein